MRDDVERGPVRLREAPPMSYDLVFWGQDASEQRAPPLIYGELLAGQDVPGLAELPVEAYLGRILEAVPDARRQGNQIVWENEHHLASFVLDATNRSVIVSLTGNWPHHLANVLIDVAQEFG